MPPEELEGTEGQVYSAEDVQRLQEDLRNASAERDRYRDRYEAEAGKTAEAERRAALDKAGELTEEERAALDDYGEVDPKGRKAIEAIDARRARREAAMLETEAVSRTTSSGGDDFGAGLDRVMGSVSWRDTIKQPAYAQWFAAQPADLRSAVEGGDVAASARALTLYEASRSEEGDVRRNDPRLDGARSAPGDLRIRSTQTRSGRASARGNEIDEDDYMAGWDYAGKDFEENYRILAPSMRDERIERARERHGR